MHAHDDAAPPRKALWHVATDRCATCRDALVQLTGPAVAQLLDRGSTMQASDVEAARLARRAVDVAAARVDVELLDVAGEPGPPAEDLVVRAAADLLVRWPVPATQPALGHDDGMDDDGPELVRLAQRIFVEELRRLPTVGELAEWTGWPEPAVEAALGLVPDGVDEAATPDAA